MSDKGHIRVGLVKGKKEWAPTLDLVLWIINEIWLMGARYTVKMMHVVRPRALSHV